MKKPKEKTCEICGDKFYDMVCDEMWREECVADIEELEAIRDEERLMAVREADEEYNKQRK